jgi:hypothetical protein
MPASGGALSVSSMVLGRGGDGSAAATINGSDGVVEGASNPGGGGGAAGRIRINTRSGSADVSSATLSPDTSGACATLGKVK